MKPKTRRFAWTIVLTEKQAEKLKVGIENHFRPHGIRAGYTPTFSCFYVDIVKGTEDRIDKYIIYISGFVQAIGTNDPNAIKMTSC
jgi:hypothetical protein